MRFFNVETQTYPCVIHANGSSKKKNRPGFESWIITQNYLKNMKETNEIIRDDLTIVTWKGGKYSGVETILEYSCNKYGVPLTILPWPSHISDFWEGSKAKIYETLKAIESGIIDTKYMMALDAGDVALLDHPNNILDKFLNEFKGYKAVWNAEANNWPSTTATTKYVHYPKLDEYLIKITKRDDELKQKLGSRFAYMNTGCTIGETDSYRSFYKNGLDLGMNLNVVDQALGKVSQFIEPENHAIDRECKIFQCLYGVTSDTLKVFGD